MPGPVLSATIHQVAKRGAQAGLLIAVGHSILELVLMVGLYLGLEQLLKDQGTALAVVGIMGGLLLLFMAWGMLRYKPAAPADSGAHGSLWLGPVASGIATSISNPMWVGWWLTVGLNYISISRPYKLAGLAAFYTGHVLADLAWYGALGVALAGGRNLAGGVLFRWLIRLCAVFMAAMAVIFLIRGGRFFWTGCPA